MENEQYFVKKKSKTVPTKRNRSIGWFALALPVLCLLVSLLLEFIPSYVELPIKPPSGLGFEDTKEWISLTYMSDISDVGRYYMWRREGIVTFQKDVSWDSLVNYFDRQLSQYGWQQRGDMLACYGFLPESRFLEYGSNGFVSYRRSDNESPLDRFRSEELICLAIWKKENSRPYTYTIVLQSIRPSFFMVVFSSIFGND